MSRIHLRKKSLPRYLQWLFDIDYLEKLTPKELEWLDTFVKEYYHGSAKKSGWAYHKKTQERRDCYNRKNRGNRDMFNKFLRVPLAAIEHPKKSQIRKRGPR
jgi:hypothetical protein